MNKDNWAKDYKQFNIAKGKCFMSLYPTKESCPNDFIKEAWDIWYEFLKNIGELKMSKTITVYKDCKTL